VQVKSAVVSSAWLQGEFSTVVVQDEAVLQRRRFRNQFLPADDR
jgi:hypothetical protein